MEYQSKISEYLKESFGWNVKFDNFDSFKHKLPYGLLGAADYSMLNIEGISVVAISTTKDNEFRWIKKLAMTVSKKMGMPSVLILDSLDSYQRRSLIENHINFIVPFRQIYLPTIGILLNERGLGTKQFEKESLSPVATSVILYYLLHSEAEGLSISELASKMDYSVKTLSLAISELERHGLVSIIRDGQKKMVHFPYEKKELWKKSYPIMVNPIEKRLFTNNVGLVKEIGVKASDTALSEISMLAEPQQEIYAVYSRNPQIKELSLNPNDGAVAVEVWKINPTITSSNGTADAFPLALSYKDDDDPRIRIELEKILNESFITEE